jgi:iron-regulated transporter 1
LTTTTGYITTTILLLSAALVTLITEFLWIEVVYRKFPVLAIPRDREAASRQSTAGNGVMRWFKREKEDWIEFSRLPIFFSRS